MRGPTSSGGAFVDGCQAFVSHELFFVVDVDNQCVAEDMLGLGSDTVAGVPGCKTSNLGVQLSKWLEGTVAGTDRPNGQRTSPLIGAAEEHPDLVDAVHACIMAGAMPALQRISRGALCGCSIELMFSLPPRRV